MKNKRAQMSGNNYRFIIVLILLSYCSISMGQNIGLKFDNILWQDDTTGSKAYRIRVDENELELVLLAKYVEQVQHLLGEPNFIAYEGIHVKNMGYCLQGLNMENNGICKGSFLTIYFRNGMVDALVYLWP